MEVRVDNVLEGVTLEMVGTAVMVEVSMTVDVVLVEDLGDDVADLLPTVAVSMDSEPSAELSGPAQSCCTAVPLKNMPIKVWGNAVMPLHSSFKRFVIFSRKATHAGEQGLPW